MYARPLLVQCASTRSTLRPSHRGLTLAHWRLPQPLRSFSPCSRAPSPASPTPSSRASRARIEPHRVRMLKEIGVQAEPMACGTRTEYIASRRGRSRTTSRSSRPRADRDGPQRKVHEPRATVRHPPRLSRADSRPARRGRCARPSPACGDGHLREDAVHTPEVKRRGRSPVVEGDELSSANDLAPCQHGVQARLLASLVECVEALTIVLAVGTTRRWRSALLGAAASTIFLALLVAVFGPALGRIPITTLQLIVGILLCCSASAGCARPFFARRV